jgi:hypothetical protein
LSKQKIRRKWSFEKGRNSSSVVFAALATLLAVLVLTGFRYDFQSPDSQRQTTEVELLPGDDEFFNALLDQYDPAHTYGINNGGVPFCLSCRRSHHPNECPGNNLTVEQNVHMKQTIPDYPFTVRIPELKKDKFPVSTDYVGKLPVPSVNDVISNTHKITDERGRRVAIAKLENLPVSGEKSSSIIRLTGKGLLVRIEIISSCGDENLDRMAGNILKAHNAASGVYTVNWVNNGGEK